MQGDRMKLECKIDPPITDMVKELEAMKAGLGEAGIRAALVSGAKPLKAAMKARAPEDLGSLKKAVGHNSLSKRAKNRLGVPAGSAAILVGSNRKIAINGKKYWQGMKAHWMEQGAEHMVARPFMEPALAAASSAMEPLFYQGLANYLDKQRAKRNP